MGVSYPAFRRLAAGLLCLLLQQCTQDLPSPAPTPSRPTATTHRFADALARGEVVTKVEKTPRTDKAPANPKAATAPGLRQVICYDYYQVYYDNMGNIVGREFLYSDCPDDDGGGGGGGDGGGSGGGGGAGGPGGSSDDDEPNTLSDTMILVERPDVPINNIRQYLKCFDTNQPATLTVYARQPVPGTNNTYTFHGLKPDIGHSFISIT